MSNEEFYKPRPLFNEKIGKDANKNMNQANNVNLKGEKFKSCYDNKRDKTVLLSNEKNYTIFSDIQLCSILDTIIYEDSKNNYVNNIKPIVDRNEICELDYIDNFFQLFGFNAYDPMTNYIQDLFDLALPFKYSPNFTKEYEYIKQHLNFQKSFYMWMKTGFEREIFKNTFKEKEEKATEIVDHLKEKTMDETTFLILHNIGISLNIKFTNVYIQPIADSFGIKAFDLGDSSANNRIFIGLYKEGGNILFYLPKLSTIEKSLTSKLNFTPSTDNHINPFVFLPNYGPVYVKHTSTSDVPYFQIFNANLSYKIKYDNGSKELTFKNMKSISFPNNDFPIYGKCYDKQVNPLKITSLEKMRLFIQYMSLNEKNINVGSYKKDICKLIFEKVFKFPTDKISEENSTNFNLNSEINVPANELKNYQYLFHLMTPNGVIPSIPCMKISSPLEIVDIMINSLSRIFFVAKFDNTKTDETNVFFGDGDFGSASLDDMFICPTSIQTNKLLSTFILSGETYFTPDDIHCVQPGVIILHKNGDDNKITHYSRTNHIWKKEKEFTVSNDIKEDSHVFFYSHKYIVIYKNDGNFQGKSYKYDDKNDPVEEKFGPIPEGTESVLFSNGKIYFRTKDKKLNKLDEQKIEDGGKMDSDEKERISDLFNTSNAEKIEDKGDFRLNIEMNFINKNDFNKEPFPVAVEINHRVHVFKVGKSNTISSILYHPAKKNSVLKYSILSTFYRYRRHIAHTYPAETKPHIIHANIDCSYNGDFGSIFKTSTSPGIYISRISSRSPAEYSYGSDWGNFPIILYTYFHNGKLQTGLTERRTLCQLAAAFACSYAISVYTSTGKIICYEPPNQNTSIWTRERCEKMVKNMIATYGTLLEMKNDYEFEFALSVLETTKDLIPDFKKFLHSLSEQ